MDEQARIRISNLVYGFQGSGSVSKCLGMRNTGYHTVYPIVVKGPRFVDNLGRSNLMRKCYLGVEWLLSWVCW
jgi:hypothetical protein